MRPTQEIKEKLTKIQKELNRISTAMITNDENDPYVFASGATHPEWTWDDALTAFVAQNLILEWVLSIK